MKLILMEMREGYVEVGGHRTRYLEAGSAKQAAVLLHGLGGYSDKWKPAMLELSEKYRVVVPDMVGYGLSDKPVIDYTPGFFIEFIGKFIGKLGLERPHLVGASLGGQVAAEYASSNGRSVSSLVLISPAGIMKKSTPALDAYIMAALYPRESSVSYALGTMENSGREASPRLVSAFMDNMSRPNAKMAFMSSLLCFKNYPDITPALGRISAPTMLVWGRDDPIIPISYAKRFTDAIRDCTLVVMDNCGHTPYVQHPRRFAEIVEGFLARQNP